MVTIEDQTDYDLIAEQQGNALRILSSRLRGMRSVPCTTTEGGINVPTGKDIDEIRIVFKNGGHLTAFDYIDRIERARRDIAFWTGDIHEVSYSENPDSENPEDLELGDQENPELDEFLKGFRIKD